MITKTINIFFGAIGYYFIATTPLLLAPEKYLLSLSIVLIYGWIAWGCFAAMYWYLGIKKMELESKWILLITCVPIAIVFAILFIENNKNWHVQFNHYRYYCFIAIASCCAWFSIYNYRKQIHKHFITAHY